MKLKALLSTTLFTLSLVSCQSPALVNTLEQFQEIRSEAASLNKTLKETNAQLKQTQTMQPKPASQASPEPVVSPGPEVMDADISSNKETYRPIFGQNQSGFSAETTRSTRPEPVVWAIPQEITEAEYPTHEPNPYEDFYYANYGYGSYYNDGYGYSYPPVYSDYADYPYDYEPNCGAGYDAYEPMPLPSATSDLSVVETTHFKGMVFNIQGQLLDGVRVFARSLNSAVPFEAEVQTIQGAYYFDRAPAGVQIEITVTTDDGVSQSQVVVTRSNKDGNPATNRFDFGQTANDLSLDTNHTVSEFEYNAEKANSFEFYQELFPVQYQTVSVDCR